MTAKALEEGFSTYAKHVGYIKTGKLKEPSTYKFRVEELPETPQNTGFLKYLDS